MRVIGSMATMVDMNYSAASCVSSLPLSLSLTRNSVLATGTPRVTISPETSKVSYNHRFPMVVAQRYVIRGRVQGVGFRFSPRTSPIVKGLTGFVRNLGDGRVEALVEGDREAVERFEMAIRQGPRCARVDEVEVTAVPPSGRMGFLIRG